MPLTTRTNGNGSSNIATASWWNDFKDLLTGVMQDQEVTVKNNLAAIAIGASPTVACSGALAAGTALGIGVYNYYYSFLSADGESRLSPVFTITTTTGNQVVSLSAIGTGPVGTTGRNLYRTKVGGTVAFKVATLADNSTSTYTDNTADSGLTQVPPGTNSFGGSLLTKDTTGAIRSLLSNDGSLSLIPVPYTITGGTGGTGSVNIYMFQQGIFKTLWADYSAYAPGTASQSFVLPTPFIRGALIRTGFIHPIQLLKGGVAQTINVLTALNSGSIGTTSSVTSLFGYAIGELRPLSGGFDTLQFSANTSADTGSIYIEGI